MAMATEEIYKCGHCGTTNDSLESLKHHMLTSHVVPQLDPTAARDPQMSQQMVTQVATSHVSQQIAVDSTSSIVTHAKMIEMSPSLQAPLVDPNQPPSEMKINKFKCGYCDIIVTTMDKLKSHMLTTHVNDETGEYAEQQTQAQQQTMDSPTKVDGLSDGHLNAKSMEDHEEGEDGELGTDVQASKVKLNFSVMIPDTKMHVFPRHIEPVLFFTCKYCDYKNKQYKSVSNHAAACYPKKLAPAVRPQNQEELKGLDVSELKAVSVKRYGRPRSRVVKLLPYPCGFCKLSFETPVDQSVHQRCHIVGSKAMRCCFCPREAPEHRSWKMLYRHIVIMHPGNVTAKHLCNFCGVACMFPRNLKIHLKTVHGVEEDPADTRDRVTCEHCLKSFKRACYLKYHLVIRHGIGTAKEKAKITAQNQRREEQKIVDKHKPMMTCMLCSYQTNYQYRLRNHTEVVHQGVKRHKCGVCNKAFSDGSTLRRHMWKHRDSKPHSCQFCRFTCIQSAHIKSHYEKKHAISPEDAKKLIRHINRPRHSLTAEGTATVQATLPQQPTHTQQVVITQQPAQQQHQQP